MINLWSTKEDKRRVEILMNQAITYQQCADILNEEFPNRFFTSDAVEGRSKRTGTTIGALKNNPLNPYSMTFEEKWNTFCNFIEKKNTKEEVEKPKLNLDVDRTLVIADLHIPFYNKNLLVETVEKWRNKCQTVAIVGDFFDMYSLSRFSHFEDVPIKQEMQEGKLVMDYLSNSFEKCLFLSGGNHEKRLEKYMASKLPSDLLFLVTTDLVGMIATDLDNVEVIDSFYYNMGDVLLSHLSVNSSVEVKTVVSAWEWFNRWESKLNFPVHPRVIIQAHSHRVGSTVLDRSGILHKLIQCPSLCSDQSYALSGDGKFQPQISGYVVVEQVKGKTIFNNTHTYIYE